MREITLKASADNIRELTAWVDEQLEAANCPVKAQLQIDVAIDEIFSNIAFYAYGSGEGDATVTLDISEDTRTAILTFSDSGAAFNPLTAEDPDLSVSAEERQMGGLGIFLVKKTMDQIEYARRDSRNILKIIKKI